MNALKHLGISYHIAVLLIHWMCFNKLCSKGVHSRSLFVIVSIDVNGVTYLLTAFLYKLKPTKGQSPDAPSSLRLEAYQRKTVQSVGRRPLSSSLCITRSLLVPSWNHQALSRGARCFSANLSCIQTTEGQLPSGISRLKFTKYNHRKTTGNHTF